VCTRCRVAQESRTPAPVDNARSWLSIATWPYDRSRFHEHGGEACPHRTGAEIGTSPPEFGPTCACRFLARASTPPMRRSWPAAIGKTSSEPDAIMTAILTPRTRRTLPSTADGRSLSTARPLRSSIGRFRRLRREICSGGLFNPATSRTPDGLHAENSRPEAELSRVNATDGRRTLLVGIFRGPMTGDGFLD